MQYIKRTNIIGRLADDLLNLAYPLSPYCFICGAVIPLENEYGMCKECMEKFSFGHHVIDHGKILRENGIEWQSSVNSAISCVKYGIYEKKMITNLKFGGKTYYARTIGKIMADRILSDDEMAGVYMDIDYIVPVPLYGKKQNERGFNQCELIAKYFRKEMPDIFEFAVRNDILFRTRETKPMKNISGYERFINLENAFKLNPRWKNKIKGKRLLLIDDVYTTGSTAEHSAYILKCEGAKEVHFFSYAGRNFLDE